MDVAHGLSCCINSSESFARTTRSIAKTSEPKILTEAVARPPEAYCIVDSAIHPRRSLALVCRHSYCQHQHSTQTNMHPTMHVALPHRKPPLRLRTPRTRPAEPCSMHKLRNSALTRGPHASTNNDDVETISAFSNETRTRSRPRLHAYTTCM